MFNADSYLDIGGIARFLEQSSVQKCYVAGHIQYRTPGDYMSFCSISYHGDENSSITHCAVGLVTKEFYSYNLHALADRITSSSDINLSNNASIDSNNQANSWEYIRDISANGLDGANVSPALFNQYYFEHTLGWDFDTVWEWNATENRPQLRPRPEQKQHTQQLNTTQVSKNQTTLLHAQMQANIWL